MDKTPELKIRELRDEIAVEQEKIRKRNDDLLRERKKEYEGFVGRYFFKANQGGCPVYTSFRKKDDHLIKVSFKIRQRTEPFIMKYFLTEVTVISNSVKFYTDPESYMKEHKEISKSEFFKALDRFVELAKLDLEIDLGRT